MAIDSGKHPYGAIGLDRPDPVKGAEGPAAADDDDGGVLRSGAADADDVGPGADKDLEQDVVDDAGDGAVKLAGDADSKALERDLDLDDDLDAAGTGAPAPVDEAGADDGVQKLDDLDDEFADAGKGAVNTALADVEAPVADETGADDDLGLNASLDDGLDEVDDDLDDLTGDEGTKLLDLGDAFDLGDAADPGAADGLDSDLAGTKGGFDDAGPDDDPATKDLDDDTFGDDDDDGGGLKGIADLFG